MIYNIFFNRVGKHKNMAWRSFNICEGQRWSWYGIKENQIKQPLLSVSQFSVNCNNDLGQIFTSVHKETRIRDLNFLLWNFMRSFFMLNLGSFCRRLNYQCSIAQAHVTIANTAIQRIVLLGITLLFAYP